MKTIFILNILGLCFLNIFESHASSISPSQQILDKATQEIQAASSNIMANATNKSKCVAWIDSQLNKAKEDNNPSNPYVNFSGTHFKYCKHAVMINKMVDTALSQKNEDSGFPAECNYIPKKRKHGHNKSHHAVHEKENPAIVDSIKGLCGVYFPWKKKEKVPTK